MTYQEAIQKAAKLLRKGEDSAVSKEESAAFLAKAQQIIDEHKLNIDDLDYDKNAEAEDNEPVKDFGYADPLDDVKYGNYRESWSLRLASLVSHHNGCDIRYQKKADKGIKLRIIGRPSDVQTVRYLYSYFRNQIDELISKHCVGNSSTYRGEFAVGCIDTLRVKLDLTRKQSCDEAKVKHSGNELAMVRINGAIARIEKRREAVTEFMNDITAQQVSSITFIPLELAKLFSAGKLAEAREWCQDNEGHTFAEAQKAYNSCFSGRGFGGAGSKTSTGGRQAGREAGQSIRITKAKAGIGQ